MIIKDQTDGALSAGVIDTIDVGISSDPRDQLMIQNILSDTLYTDKISAVWREYGVNGMDANIEAGRGDWPIRITLPTQARPNAIIRDFGYGMSSDQVRNTYCKAGASTKRASNEVTGCLGIGSKAGYAYGPAFVVTSFQGQKKTVYNCFKDKGIPKMAIMQQADAPGEADGVEISVPVKSTDISEFNNRAERVYRYFKVRPEITNGTALGFKWLDDKTHLTGTGWRLTGSGESVAIMGNVGYTLEERLLPGDFPAQKKALVQAGIELDFKMGELEISANRESIQYKDETLHAISKVLGIALNEIAGRFTKQIDGAASLWEATKMYGKLFDATGSYGMQQVRKTVDGKVKWRGNVVKSGRFNIAIDDGTSTVGGPNQMKGVRTLEYSQRTYYVRGKRLNKYNNPYEVNAADSTLFVLNDNKSKAIQVQKIRYWFEQHHDILTIIVLTFDDAAAQKEYWTKRNMDGVPLVKMSDMPKPPLVPGQSVAGVSQHRSKHQARALVLDEQAGQHAWPRSVNWTTAVVDKTAFGIYVPIEAYDPNDKMLGMMSCHKAREIIKAARDLGYVKPDEQIIGVKYKDGKPSTKLGDKWKTLGEVIAYGIQKSFTKEPKMAQWLADYHTANSYTPFIPPKVAPKLAKSPARTLLEEYKRMIDGSSLRAMHILYRLIPSMFKATLPKATVELDKEEKTIWQRYPMLKYAEYSLRNCDRANELQNAIDYINLVESALVVNQTAKP